MDGLMGEHKKKEEKDMATLKRATAALVREIASLKKDVAMNMKDDKEKEHGVANKSGVSEHDALKGSERQTPTAAALAQEVATLKAQVAMEEEEKKKGMTDDIMGMMKEDGMAMDEEEDVMRKEMMEEDMAALASKLKFAQAYHNKIAEANVSAGLASKPGRVVRMASVASVDGASRISHDQIRGLLP